jgi:hypothetical protein
MVEKNHDVYRAVGKELSNNLFFLCLKYKYDVLKCDRELPAKTGSAVRME